MSFQEKHINDNRYTIDDLKKYAQEMGGDCLSKVYTNQYKRYKWRCKEGHTWFSTFDSVKHQKTWCPYCNSKKGSHKVAYKKTEQILKKLGWKRISDYSFKGITLICEYGHQFSIVPQLLSEDSKCPVCEKEKKEEILRAKVLEIIKNKNGVLVSDRSDIHTVKSSVITCNCDKGHTFQMSVNNLLNRNSWCQKCGNERRKNTLKKFQQMKKNKVATK